MYVFHFWVELVHLLEAAFGSQEALQQLVTSIGYKQAVPITSLNETVIMLVVLALIDVVMISNLLIMVIVGGYETFVSRMGLQGHPDQPEWLSHVNASVLKVKLATAIIGISSIHLLKTFINADNYTDRVLIAQTAIHITFLLSAIAIAYTDKIMSGIASAGTEPAVIPDSIRDPCWRARWMPDRVRHDSSSDHLLRPHPLVELLGRDEARGDGGLAQAGALLVRLLGDLGGLVVADVRIQRRDQHQ